MLEARRLIGTREIPGTRHNAEILRWWASIHSKIRNDETPYCAAFVGHCLESTKILSTRSEAARSYAKWGEAVEGPYHMAYGAILVLSRPGAPSWSGHVTFLTGYDPDAEVFQGLGANQDNQVRFSEYPAKRLVALRWPKLWPSYFGAGMTPVPALRCPPFRAKGAVARSDA